MVRGAARATVLLLLAALLPAVGWAQPPPGTTPQAGTASAREAARGFADQAVKLYDAGDFTLALELFEKADELDPKPQFRVYVARAYARLGKLKRSLRKYDEALAMPLPPGAPPSVVEGHNAAELERAEIAKRIPSLRIDVAGAPAEAVTLTVDGETVSAQKWARVELDPGRHRIEATAPRTRGRSETVELREGGSSSVTVTLQPLGEAPPPRPFRPLAITAGALAGAGLVVAIATGVVLAEKRSQILTACPNNRCTPDGLALINSVAPINHVNLGGWIVTAAGGVATIVFVALDQRGSKPATAIVPAPLPGGGGLWVARSF